ncbi:MAG: hypothetical protein K6F92_00990 [Lachnospiraceae bacterium]|nr:hypothetical protein [Lachnospiraceae bacterium]
MTCPRCGKVMYGGICNNCGFPLTRIKTKAVRKTTKLQDKKLCYKK